MKSKITLFVATFFLNVPLLFSQALTVNSQQLNFGSAYENSPVSLPLTIQNTLNRTVNVNGIIFYNTYGAPAFSASEDHFAIAPVSSHIIWITFSPRHNIFHNSEMVIVNDGLRGYVSVDLRGQGKYSIAYYDSTQNYSEEALKTALSSVTGAGFISLGYNIARDSMFMSIDNKKTNGQGAAQNTIECIYTGREAVGYFSRSDCQTNYSFNTEHTFPQTFFGGLEPMKSDLHQIFGTDDLANNYRADNPYGVVNGATIWAVGGSKATNSLFEPRDAQKGIAARAMMYFVLRYQNYGGFFTSQENILRTWNQNFPVDALQRKRNNDISLIQHNRNPFIDYPQFIERINSISNNSVAPVVRSVDVIQDTIIYGYIPVATPTIFHYVLVNKGNADVQLSNFSLSQTELTFQSGGTNTTLASGEALSVDIELLTQNNSSIHATLNFNTNDAGHLSVSVPVYANDSVFDNINEEIVNEFIVFPVPAHEQIRIFGKNSGFKKIEVYDTMGKIVFEFPYQVGSDEITFNISGLSAGIYFLKMSGNEKISFRKFVKE